MKSEPLPVWVRRLGSHAGRHLVRLILLPHVDVHLIQPVRPLPAGRLIVAANHISHFDPPLIGGFFPRQIDWMAMEELFRSAWSARLMWALGAFPVNRGGADRAAIRTAVERLRAGAAVGIFPEGGIRAGESSLLGGAAIRPGVAVVSAMGEAPVVPCVILGSERLYNRRNWRLFRRVPVWIAVGEPIPPMPHDAGSGGRDAFCAKLQRAMVDLQTRLVTTYGLTPDDLPKTPQARKGEDPYLPDSR